MLATASLSLPAFRSALTPLRGKQVTLRGDGAELAIRSLDAKNRTVSEVRLAADFSGEATVSLGKLKASLRARKEPSVSLAVDGDRLRLIFERSAMSIDCEPAGGFGAMAGAELTVYAGHLRDAVAHAKRATAEPRGAKRSRFAPEARERMSLVQLDATDAGRVYAVGCDGRRVHLGEVPADNVGAAGLAHVAASQVSAILAALPGRREVVGEPVTLTLSPDGVRVAGDGWAVEAWQGAPAKPLDWRRVLPESGDDLAELAADELAKVAKLAAICAADPKAPAVDIDGAGGELVASASAPDGARSEVRAAGARIDGAPRVRMNARYLADALAQVPGGSVALATPEDGSSATLTLTPAYRSAIGEAVPPRSLWLSAAIMATA